MTDEFGLLRRNAFYSAGRCGDAGRDVAFSLMCAACFPRELEAFSLQNDEVTLHLKTAEGQQE